MSAQDQNRTAVFAGEAEWVTGCAPLWWISRDLLPISINSALFVVITAAN